MKSFLLSFLLFGTLCHAQIYSDFGLESLKHECLQGPNFGGQSVKEFPPLYQEFESYVISEAQRAHYEGLVSLQNLQRGYDQILQEPQRLGRESIKRKIPQDELENEIQSRLLALSFILDESAPCRDYLVEKVQFYLLERENNFGARGELFE